MESVHALNRSRSAAGMPSMIVIIRERSEWIGHVVNDSGCFRDLGDSTGEAWMTIEREAKATRRNRPDFLSRFLR
jgi:hypothetical protein